MAARFPASASMQKMANNPQQSSMFQRSQFQQSPYGISCDPGWVCTDMAGPKATKSPEEGALTPVYAALLPINVGKPQGEFLQKKMIQEWEEMSTRSHASEAEERLKKE